MRSRAWTKPVPKRPLTQSIPSLDWLAGTSSAITARRWSSRTLRVMPQPTPQYGHVVSTRRAMGAGTSLGRSAPVGHVATHWPHEVHTDADMRASPATPTFMACPRPSIEMAPIFCTSSQAVVHRPHRMHASRSSTKKDLDASVSKWWSAVKRRPRETVARGGGADLAEAIPPLPVREHRAGQVEDGGADARGLGMRGADDHALAGGQMAGGGGAAHALDVDETGPAGAERRAVGILAELRQRDAEAVDRIEHGGAGVELDRPIVDDQLHGGLIIKDKPASGNRVSGVRDARRYNTAAHRRTSP